MSIKITVITPVLNGVKYIDRAINSVINQRYSDIEYIVIDGGSNDGTLDIINSHLAKIHLFISEKDNGIYDAINKGLQHASGEIIGIINADDFYLPEAFNTVVQEFEGSSIDVIHGNQLLINDYGSFYHIRNQKPRNLKEFTYTMAVFHPTCFISKHVYEKEGFYNASYKFVADYEFLMKIYMKGYRFHYVNTALAGFTYGGYSSTNMANREVIEFYKQFNPGAVFQARTHYWKQYIKSKIASLIHYEEYLKNKRLNS